MEQLPASSAASSRLAMIFKNFIHEWVASAFRSRLVVETKKNYMRGVRPKLTRACICFCIMILSNARVRCSRWVAHLCMPAYTTHWNRTQNLLLRKTSNEPQVLAVCKLPQWSAFSKVLPLSHTRHTHMYTCVCIFVTCVDWTALAVPTKYQRSPGFNRKGHDTRRTAVAACMANLEANFFFFAFITANSSLEPWIQGLCAQIHVNLRWRVFCRNRTGDLTDY